MKHLAFMATKSLTDVPETNHDAMTAVANHRASPIDATSPHEPIPGERDPGTLTHRQAGAMTGRFNGADAVTDGLEETLDRTTKHDRELEGGGDR